MKLSELAEIRKGIEIPPQFLVNHKPQEGKYMPYIEGANFQGQASRYVGDKALRTLKIATNRVSLSYGDFFLVRTKEYKMYRYEQSDRAIPSSDIIVISSSLSIVTQFFGYAKNRKYFLSEVKKRENSIEDILSTIASIEIMTDSIRELEDADVAEQIGIRRPVKKEDLPFRLTQKPMTLDKLMKRIAYGELLLDTEFQRRPGLWDLNTKSRFIEALIVRLPIPAFYFDGSNDDQWLVIDGLQRLSTINSFLKGEFSLTNLDFLSDLENKSFEELERPLQRNIEEYEVFSYIIEKGTPQSVKYKIFKNINTSALRLESQEIRHAINPGKPAIFVKRIAETIWFKDWVPTTKQDRMYDREVVLRYIAFQNKHYTDYSPTIVEYLDEAMTNIYDLPEHALNELEKDLERICGTLFTIMGEPCFSRSAFMDGTKTYIHNNVIFETLTYGFSKIRVEHLDKLSRKKDEIRRDIKRYMYDQPTAFWDRDLAYSKEGLESRFKDIESFVNELVKSRI